jgi:hypothetical protein
VDIDDFGMPFGKKPVQGSEEEFSFDRLKNQIPSERQQFSVLFRGPRSNLESVSVIPGPIRSRALLFQKLPSLPAVIPTKTEHEQQQQQQKAGATAATNIQNLAQAVCCAKLFLSEMEALGMGNLDVLCKGPLEFVSKDVNGVIHIGAHTGQEAAWYFASHIAQKVVHIECNPNMIPRLEENVKGFGHVAIQACLWNVAGEERDFFFTDR